MMFDKAATTERHPETKVKVVALREATSEPITLISEPSNLLNMLAIELTT